MPTARELARQRKTLRAERERDLRKRDREELRRLRARLKAARAHRRKRVAEVRAACRRHRQAHRERVAALRAALRAERARKPASCSAVAAEVHRGADSVARASKALEAESQHQGSLRIWKRKKPLRGSSSSSRRAERASESDDAVRANLPAELVPVFDRVRRQIHESARRTRTEAFLEWAHDHPGDVLAIQEAAVYSSVRELAAREAELREALEDPRHYRRLDDSELLARYESYSGAPEVPF